MNKKLVLAIILLMPISIFGYQLTVYNNSSQNFISESNWPTGSQSCAQVIPIHFKSWSRSSQVIDMDFSNCKDANVNGNMWFIETGKTDECFNYQMAITTKPDPNQGWICVPAEISPKYHYFCYAPTPHSGCKFDFEADGKKIYIEDLSARKK